MTLYINNIQFDWNTKLKEARGFNMVLALIFKNRRNRYM